MKKIITLLTLISISFFGFSQLGNPSFENWENPLLHNTINATIVIGTNTVYSCGDFDYHELENWSSTNQITVGSNFGDTALVNESTNAIDGAKSVIIESKNIELKGYLDANCFIFLQGLPNVSPGLIVNGSFNLDIQDMIDDIISGQGLNAMNPFAYPGVGEEIDFIPKTLTGSYKYTGGVDAVSGVTDSCIIVSGLKKNGEIIGIAIARFGNAASFTDFTLEYEHFNCETPDTIITLISSSSIDFSFENGDFVVNSDFTGIHGSILHVDGLHIDTILPSEFPPLLMNDVDTILTIDVSTVDVLANDEFCVAPFPITIDYYGSEGTAVLNGNNEIEFTPATGFVGTVVIPYYSCNNIPLCDTAYLTIEVNPIPACIAYEDIYAVDFNGTIEKDPRLNDIDCGTVIQIATNPANGIANVTSNNNISYSPNNNYAGQDSMEYSICSSQIPTQCSTAKIYFNVVSGIDEIDNSLIKFYPNPAKNILNVSVDVTADVNITIYNTLGKIVYSEMFNNSLIVELNKINNGVYFVEIETNGKKSIRKLQVIK